MARGFRHTVPRGASCRQRSPGPLGPSTPHLGSPTLDAQTRLTELETKLTFQEATSDTLSEVILTLEGRLEALEKRLRLVEARGSGVIDGEEPDPLDERPPHY